ncbi:MAG: hypothetical protein GY794_16270 [bacterium]|nr:hypothetical protein [bacterium]
MTNIIDAWQAGVDAVVADNGLTKNEFTLAVRTVLTSNFSPTVAGDWVDAVATEFNRLGLINNPTWNNLRGNIINSAVDHMELFEALVTIGQLPETLPAIASALIISLRADRDQIDTSIDRLNVLIDTESDTLVKEAIRAGKLAAQEQKQRIRDEIQAITGDPDA